jgi:hypothetical protein
MANLTTRRRQMKRIGVLAAAAIVLGLACSRAPESGGGRRPLTPSEKKLIENAVRERLRDPESARFEWLQVVELSTDKDTNTYCGFVNAKNSFGGYVGKQLFTAVLTKKNPTLTYIGISEQDRVEETQARQEWCIKAGYEELRERLR